MANEKTKSPMEVTTPLVRFSYANVWEAKSTKQQDGTVTPPKFSITCLIPKTDIAGLAKVQKAVNAALAAGITEKWKGKKPANLKMPIHDGDEKYNEDETKYAAYEGMWYITASNKVQPKIVNAAVEQILERDQFYSGCWGKASLRFFAFDNVSKGVGCQLNNLQKLNDGENLGGGRSNPEDDFENEDI